MERGNNMKPIYEPRGAAKEYGDYALNIYTGWVSFEPVVEAEGVLRDLRAVSGYVDRVKIGKLNYHRSDIDWKQFGRAAEALCRELGVDYAIKNSLRAEMEAR
jgi:hypothetical protein